jgi:type III secretion protein T
LASPFSLTDLAGLQSYLLALTFTMPRFLAALMILPVTSSELMPATVRNGLAITFAAFVAPQTLAYGDISEFALPLLAALMFKEVAIGSAIGFCVGCVIWCFEALGALIDFQSGQENSSIFNPLSDSETATYSRFLGFCASATFLAAGGLAITLGLLMESFVSWPVAKATPDLNIFVQQVFRVGFQSFLDVLVRCSIAIIVLVLLVDLFFGIANKYAQHLNVFQLAFPVKGLMVILGLWLIIGTSIDLQVFTLDKIVIEIRRTIFQMTGK